MRRRAVRGLAYVATVTGWGSGPGVCGRELAYVGAAAAMTVLGLLHVLVTGVAVLLVVNVIGLPLLAVVLPAAGEAVLDPEVVTQVMGGARRAEALAALTPRERQVLATMAQGRSNHAIAAVLHLSYGAVEKHVSQIFAKLGLPVSGGDHRRVLAVLHYLRA
ncbi:response regulator transcription factor [Nonomuraea longicatena]|uniref:HTH luxR-type domain-containing protein n=1 Tax=Nonomuraea longicatena TaxID=83682 RepID=A0ABP4AJN1_9ACTN